MSCLSSSFRSRSSSDASGSGLILCLSDKSRSMFRTHCLFFKWCIKFTACANAVLHKFLLRRFVRRQVDRALVRLQVALQLKHSRHDSSSGSPSRLPSFLISFQILNMLPSVIGTFSYTHSSSTVSSILWWSSSPGISSLAESSVDFSCPTMVDPSSATQSVPESESACNLHITSNIMLLLSISFRMFG